MNISFQQIEQYKENSGVKASFKAGVSQSERSASAQAAGSFLWDKNASVIGNQAYREEGEKAGLLEEASSFDAKNSKDFMVVMSNTMSDEDYAKLTEGGSNPGDYEPGEMVTVLDEIKVKLAQAGVHVAGYTDDIDADTIKEVTGSETYANAIAGALKEKNLPATDKNIKDCYNEMEKASHLTGLSDGAKKYLLENGLEPTIDAMYKATYAGAKDASAQPGGYFGAGAEGYFAKKGTVSDITAMEDQIQNIIEKAGLAADEETLQNAHWLLEKGLPLTENHLIRLKDMNAITFPMSEKEAALAAADAIAVDVSKAQEIYDKTQTVTKEDVTELVAKGKTLNLYQLFQMQNERGSLTVEANIHAKAVSVDSADSNKAVAQMLEIQIQMSAQANLKLMRQGIHIELEPLDRLLDLLKQQESIFHATELANVSAKAEEIKSMPAATLGISVQQAWLMQGSFTLDHVYEEGKSLAQTYAKAGESYEAMMTAPRADLGDSIKTAFRNVEELLAENGFDTGKDNQRAARILGYNGMEITMENMDAVKEADSLLTRVLSNLTPEKILSMIRRGINPLEMNMDALNEYLAAEENPLAETEKYSSFLYRLEKNHAITPEEKEAYIGIYRLLRQIEKSDGAALGAVVAGNRELNLENLLGAVRTRKKGYIDAKVDDAFGLLQDVETRGKSITDQILNYFRNRAAGLADEMGRGREDAADAISQEDLQQLRQSGMVSEEHFASLIRDEIPVTANHVMAQQALAGGSSLYEELLKADKSKNFEKKLERIREAMDEGEEAVKEAFEDMESTATEVVKEESLSMDNHIDVRSMAMYGKQIQLINSHARHENYYVPMQTSDEWTMVHVQIVSGSGEGKVSIDFKGSEDESGRITATFTVKEERIEGLVSVTEAADVDKYLYMADKCAKEILAKTGKEADITCVQSNTVNLDAFLTKGTEQPKTSTRMLYQVAKAFIHTIEQEVSTDEN